MPHGVKLPDPCCPLGKEVGKNLTEEANKEVALVLENSSHIGSTKQHHKPYLKLTHKQKDIVAKYAVEHGMVRAIGRFSKELCSTLKESTICGWKKAFFQQLHARKKSGESTDITAIIEKKDSHPLMLGADLDGKVRTYIQEARCLGNAINTRVVIACAMGIMKKKDSSLLAINGSTL